MKRTLTVQTAFGPRSVTVQQLAVTKRAGLVTSAYAILGADERVISLLEIHTFDNGKVKVTGKAVIGYLADPSYLSSYKDTNSIDAMFAFVLKREAIRFPSDAEAVNLKASGWTKKAAKLAKASALAAAFI